MTDADRLWAKRNLSSYRDFEDFVNRWMNRANIETMKHFVPQYRFLCRAGSMFPEVDFVGFYENLAEDFSYITEKLRIPGSLMPMNKTKGRKIDYKEYYTDFTREKVGDLYREDIEIFGYDFYNSSLKEQLAVRAGNVISG